MRSLLLLPILLSSVGCTSVCDDTTRMNGTWAMFHAVRNLGAEGGATVDEAYPTYEVIPNGWTRWELVWSAGGNATVRITDAPERQGAYGTVAEQSFSGTMKAEEGNCNRVRMDLEGVWRTAGGTEHPFAYGADLTFTGDGLAGSFTYADTWTGYAQTDTGTVSVEGALTGAAGEVRGVRQEDGFDTGFAR